MSGESGPRHSPKSNLVSGEEFRRAAMRIRVTHVLPPGEFLFRLPFIRSLLQLLRSKPTPAVPSPNRDTGRDRAGKLPLRFAPLFLLAFGISCWGAAPKIKDADCLS